MSEMSWYVTCSITSQARLSSLRISHSRLRNRIKEKVNSCHRTRTLRTYDMKETEKLTVHCCTAQTQFASLPQALRSPARQEKQVRHVLEKKLKRIKRTIK